ncbi:MAG TPA: hypothetical protein V6D27_01080 [Vampirovibrionales bacterium]
MNSCQNCTYYHGSFHLPCAVHPETTGNRTDDPQPAKGWVYCADWATKPEAESQGTDKRSAFITEDEIDHRRQNFGPIPVRPREMVTHYAQMTAAFLREGGRQETNPVRGIEALLIDSFIRQFPEMLNSERLWGTRREYFGARNYEDIRARILVLAGNLETLARMEHNFAVEMMTACLRQIDRQIDRHESMMTSEEESSDPSQLVAKIVRDNPSFSAENLGVNFSSSERESHLSVYRQRILEIIVAEAQYLKLLGYPPEILGRIDFLLNDYVNRHFSEATTNRQRVALHPALTSSFREFSQRHEKS